MIVVMKRNEYGNEGKYDSRKEKGMKEMVIKRMLSKDGIMRMIEEEIWEGEKERKIDVDVGESVKEDIEKEEKGDVVRISEGRNEGEVVIEREIEMKGEKGEVIEGIGKGNEIKVNEKKEIVRGMEVKGYGEKMNDIN